jgi:cell division transport system permease protein
MFDPALEKPSPVFPQGAAPLRSLTITMAVMCYLACLAIGALVLINQAASAWTQGISREVTVQIRQHSGADVEQELAQALTILKAAPGVVAVEALDKSAGAKLLEPWLGKVPLDELPVPRLIRVTINETSPPDYKALEKQLTKQVPDASLDTHRRWQAELSRMAHALSLLAVFVLGLISLASIMLVVFAARAVLESNRGTVEVLALMGAQNKFISRQNDRQFLATGLIAGFAGLIAGLITFAGLFYLGGSSTDAMAEAGRSLIFAPAAVELRVGAALVLVPIAATLIALWTSRITLSRMLRSMP